MFNKAIVAAPQNGEGKGRDLSLAVANRSACLLRLGYRDLCLQQVQLALAAGYPSELRLVQHLLLTQSMEVDIIQQAVNIILTS